MKEVLPMKISGMQDKTSHIPIFWGANVIKELKREGEQIGKVWPLRLTAHITSRTDPSNDLHPSQWSLQQSQVCDAPAHHLRSRGLDRHRAHRSVMLSSPEKDLQEKSYTQKVRESAFTEKEERQIIRENFFSFLQQWGNDFSQKGEKTYTKKC